MKTSYLLLVAALAACDQPITTSTASQAVTCDSCPPTDTVTVVHFVGDEYAPTQDQLDLILSTVPANTEDPTVSDMLLAAEGVLAMLPPELIDDAIDELARIGGTRVGCVIGGPTWTCYFYLAGRTYYCSAGRVMGCGSFLGQW